MDFDLILQRIFLTFLIDQEVITAEQSTQIVQLQREKTPPIGKIALNRRILSVQQISRVLNQQAESRLRFGEQAVALGYTDEATVTRLLALQRQSRPSVSTLLLELRCCCFCYYCMYLLRN